ncbi:MAG: cyclic lactone autoinducer peptide [Syntrophomonadaceae bacterium]|nr:cyclic lactone autoinducer peptide [Syntrophomonadaceae bacterium]
MFARIRSIMCTCLAAVFAFVAASNVSVCCPVVFYQPELPREE